MSEIVLDVEKLHQKSHIVDVKNTDVVREILDDLKASFPENASGLAAPQLGRFDRVFAANLSSGRHYFFNPDITWKSPDMTSSTEGCLSLPGITKTVSRHHSIKIKADKVFKQVSADTVVIDFGETQFRGYDAIVCQHEFDHLEGVLITDLAEAKTNEQKAQERIQKRAEKLTGRRSHKKQPVLSKINPKREAKMIEQAKRYEKRQQRAIIEQEKLRIEQKNLFESQSEPQS